METPAEAAGCAQITGIEHRAAGARDLDFLRLENAGDAPLLIIEVQSGSYLGEDDIERFEDRYGRG